MAVKELLILNGFPKFISYSGVIRMWYEYFQTFETGVCTLRSRLFWCLGEDESFSTM